MASYRDPPTRAERAKAIAAVAAIHIALAALVFSKSRAVPGISAQAPTQLIDVTLPPPPQPPPKPAARPEREEGAVGKKANPSPIVLPPPRIALPASNPLPTAPVAGSGSATSAGSATAGTGPGAGGTGSGSGGGGAGGEIGEDARLLSGGLSRRDYRRLRDFAAPSGRAVLAILITGDGRVARCSVRQSSGDPALDTALCAILQPRMVWAPARDRNGRPLTVGIIYTAVWSRD